MTAYRVRAADLRTRAGTVPDQEIASYLGRSSTVLTATDGSEFVGHVQVMADTALATWELKSSPWSTRIATRASGGASSRRASRTPGTAARGVVVATAAADTADRAITLAQRFGSLVNLNVHFHLLVPDGVFAQTGTELAFTLLPAPTGGDLLAILDRGMRRVARRLDREAPDNPGLADARRDGARDGKAKSVTSTRMPQMSPWCTIASKLGAKRGAKRRPP